MTIADRVIRAGSQQTRREILLVASRLFGARGYAAVSVHQVAGGAGVFPNQVTYHFGSKDGLFVEAAGRLILEAGQAAEISARSARSITEYQEILTASILGEGLPAVLAFIEATLIARRRSNFVPQIKATMDRLYEQGARATSEVFAQKRWDIGMSAESSAQTFWSSMMGQALQLIAAGATSTCMSDDCPRAGRTRHAPSKE
ncbi:helix-turn-helix domain-containing protein [Bradyrhizobium sp. UFLA05-109]